MNWLVHLYIHLIILYINNIYISSGKQATLSFYMNKIPNLNLIMTELSCLGETIALTILLSQKASQKRITKSKNLMDLAIVIQLLIS